MRLGVKGKGDTGDVSRISLAEEVESISIPGAAGRHASVPHQNLLRSSVFCYGNARGDAR
jgi:hypothetical protein